MILSRLIVVLSALALGARSAPNVAIASAAQSATGIKSPPTLPSIPENGAINFPTDNKVKTPPSAVQDAQRALGNLERLILRRYTIVGQKNKAFQVSKELKKNRIPLNKDTLQDKSFYRQFPEYQKAEKALADAQAQEDKASIKDNAAKAEEAIKDNAEENKASIKDNAKKQSRKERLKAARKKLFSRGP
jgi:hypothetical protein